MDRVNTASLRGEIMATIVIKDLPESTELDRQAMVAITGGARFRASATGVTRPAARRIQLFDLSRGSTTKAAATSRPPSR
jgi:hypothetical protein